MLGNPNHYFYECTRAKPITAATVDTLGQALLAAKAEQERAIALAEAAAEALAPIAHYRKVDARACRLVAGALPNVSVYIHRRPEIYGKDFRQVSVVQRGEHFTQVWANLIGDLPSATAILDRFLHHAQIINISGKSYRMKNRACKNSNK